MNKILLTLFALSFTFGVYGCTDDDKDAKAGAGNTGSATAAMKVDKFLNEVPAETAYFVNFDSSELPQSSLKLLKESLSKNKEITEALNKAAQSTNAEERFAGLLAKGVFDNFIANTLGKMGVDERPRVTMHGLGLWPVITLKLANTKGFETWLSGVEKAAKITAKQETHEGVAYRLYPVEPEVSSVLVIRDNKALLAVVPTEIKTQMLNYLVGKQKPTAKLSESKTFARLSKTYAKSSKSLTYLDTVEMFKTAAAEGTGLNKSLVISEMKANPIRNDPVCTAEIAELLGNAPYIVAVPTELTETVNTAEITWELSKTWATGLKTIASSRAGSSAPSGLFTLGVAFDSGKIIDLVQSAAKAVAAKPFKCGDLMDINRSLAETNGKIMFVPPFARAFRALDITLTGLSGTDGGLMAANPSGHLLLSAENAPLVFEAVKGLLPMLAALPALKDDGQPVPLQFPLPPSIKSPHIGIGKHALGISFGTGEEKKLQAILSSGKTSPAPIVGFAYDFDALMKILTLAASEPQAAQAVKEIMDLGLSGKASMSLRFTDRGISITSRQVTQKK